MGYFCPQEMTIKMMATLKLTKFNPDFFILVRIPELEQVYVWIEIPFLYDSFTIYLVALSDSGILLYLITMDRSLYVPMFFFFSILASADFILCITCVPKTLGILWLKAQIIIISYLPHPVVFSPLQVLLDSAIVLGMAFDHYMVICSPLRYTLVS